MNFNKFLFFETVNISDGNTALVKNYYPANNFVVLYAHSNNDIRSIKPGMTITGQSSKFSKTLTEWNYSTPENGDMFDKGHNGYPWESYLNKIIGCDVGFIVSDEIYNSYPRDNIASQYDANVSFEILDLQFDESIILDN